MAKFLQFLIYFIILLITVCLGILERDHAMSVAGLKYLMHTESLFINVLEQYTKALESKIETIESFLDEVRKRNRLWSQSPWDYLENPLNSYSLIRRLHEDWTYLEVYMSQPVGPEHADNVKSLYLQSAPSIMDMEDAMKAFGRLQIYYDLEVAHLAKGLIDGKQYNSELSSLDCFAMGKFYQEWKLKQCSLDWFKVALEKYNHTRDGELYERVYDLTVPDLYGEYAHELANKGDLEEALNVLNKVADLHPNLWLQRRVVQDSSHIHTISIERIKEPVNRIQRGCRGLFTAAVDMFCYLQNYAEPFLILAPLKVEILSLEPYVALYHDVIYDNEIEDLMSVDLDNMKHDRSDIHNNSMKYTTVDVDLKDVLNYRVMHMTDMNVDYDKDFLLINYGLGGHMSLHSDAEVQIRHQGSLISPKASIVFFLSDVLQGGATLFYDLRIAVKPKRGAALIWHNLDEQQEVDDRLDHLSCPVLVGSKWTLIKYLYNPASNI